MEDATEIEVSELQYSTYDEIAQAGIEEEKEASDINHALEVISNILDANSLMASGPAPTAREVELIKVIANMSVAGTDTPAEYVGSAMEGLTLTNAAVNINDLYSNVVAKVKTSINRSSATFLTTVTALVTLSTVAETRLKKLRTNITQLKMARAERQVNAVSVQRPPQSIFIEGIRYPKSLMEYQAALSIAVSALDEFIRNSHELAIASAGVVHDFKNSFTLNKPPEEQLLDFEKKYKAVWDKTISKTSSLKKVRSTDNSVFRNGPTLVGGYRIAIKEPTIAPSDDFWSSGHMRLSNYGFNIEHDKKPLSAITLVMPVAPLGELDKTISTLESLLDRISTATNKLSGVKATLGSAYKDAYRNVEKVYMDQLNQNKGAGEAVDRAVMDMHAPIVRDLYNAQQRASSAVTESLTVASKLIDGGYILIERHLSTYK